MSSIRLDLISLLISFLGFIPACSPVVHQTFPSVTPERQLTPYHATTATSTALPADTATETPQPAPSPTPITHTVKAGEDMGGIAYRYGITLQALKDANPEVDPNIMSVGIILLIPSSGVPAASDTQPSPTPNAILLSTPRCHPSQEGGLWCFLRADNPSGLDIESISAEVQLTLLENGEMITREASPPLNLLVAGGWLPLMVFFPPPIPEKYKTGANVIAALPVSSGDARYLRALPENIQTEITASGLSASVRGDISFEGQMSAVRANVTVVALDDQGNIIGMRNWGSDIPPTTGERIPFVLQLYSTAGKIDRIEVLAEGIRQ